MLRTLFIFSLLIILGIGITIVSLALVLEMLVKFLIFLNNFMFKS